MSVPPRRWAPPAAAAVLAAALVVGTALPASAHVHVDPATAKAGATDVALTFSVPNESADATTTAVAIAIPADAGFGAVTAQPVAGWKVKVQGPADAPTGIVFTARGDGVGDGQTQRFVVTVATIPDTGHVELPVTQTYSDDTVVAWDEPTPASGEEPEHPAPTLYINDTAPADHDADADADEDGEGAVVHTEATDGETPFAISAFVVGATGLGVGLLGVVLAAIALLRTRRAGR